MSLELLDAGLRRDVDAMVREGRAKAPERIIVDYKPPHGQFGPRYRLKGMSQDFIRMNSNSYLSLSHHPSVIAAADAATHKFGAGPGAVSPSRSLRAWARSNDRMASSSWGWTA